MDQQGIKLDLDQDRIRTILKEAYEVCKDLLEADFYLTREEFVAKIDPYLNSNRISTVVGLHLQSYKYPELVIEVDLRRKKMISRLANKKVQVHLNRFLTKL